MSIKYDDFVKRPFEESEYDPEQVNELYACMDDFWSFQKHVQIIHPDRGEIPFQPYDFQKEIIKTVLDTRFTIVLCARQAGKTVSVSVYALWYAVFNSDKEIGIVSNKQSSAIYILSIIKRMYESLPAWIKPGVKEYSKLFVQFDNGTKISVSATSADAFRGRPLNLLICDEFAFVRKGIAEDFWSANYPTISTSVESKIIVISTPNGMFNLFHRLYSGAEREENTFKHLKFNWTAVPGRDKEWAAEQLANLGPTKFAQEQDVEFLGSISTVIDTAVLEQLFLFTLDPETLDLGNKFRVYEKVEQGSRYVIGVDTAKGTGEHFSTIQVLKIMAIKPIMLKQVAVYESNEIDVYKFSDTVNRVAIYYNQAYIMAENNAEGAAVVSRLWWDHENEGLVNSGGKTKDLGIRASRASKPRAVLLMKKLIEDGSLSIVDSSTVNQLASFIEKNNKFFGKDMPDDLVTGLYWAVYLFTMRDVLEESMELKGDDNLKGDDEGWGILSDLDEMIDDWSWLDDVSIAE